MYLERGDKKVFACSVDWPGWCRSGKDDDAALAALAAYEPRYRSAISRARARFPRDAVRDLSVVERVAGSGATDFGVPHAVPDVDRRRISAADAKRNATILRAAWATLDRVVAASPPSLRKGPRGGGRDRDPMLDHVVEAERSYARTIGVRHPPFDPADTTARDAMRAEVLDVLSEPSDGSPLGGAKGWPARYAVRRFTWHVLDHAWEMQDKS